MPAEFITLPIRMKSGAASSGNELAAIAIFCGTTMPGMPAKKGRRSRRGPSPRRWLDRGTARRTMPPGSAMISVIIARTRGLRQGGHCRPGVGECERAHGQRRDRHDGVHHAEREEQRDGVDIRVTGRDQQAVVEQHAGERDTRQRADELDRCLDARRRALSDERDAEVAAFARGDDPADERRTRRKDTARAHRSR